MIELIAPKECPCCGEKMIIDDRRIATCNKENEHEHFRCIVVYQYMAASLDRPLGVNIYLGHWQFSFQEHTTIVLHNREPFSDLHLAPIPVELDYNKLQYKLKTILTFG